MLTRAVTLLVLVCASCSSVESTAAPSGPEQVGTFLNGPAGQPPAPLVPEFVSLHVVGAEDAVRVEAAARALVPAGRVTTGLPDKAPLIPLLRVDVGGAPALERRMVTSLVEAGARGSLLFWYPLAEVRDRLGDGGTAGLWRGIIAVRDAVPGAGELGGTPLLHAIAVAATDKGLVSLETVGPADMPGADPGLFKGPGGTPVVYIRTTGGVTTPAFEALIENLNAVRNQGGRLWVIVGLPLAQPHIPPRF